MANGLTLHVFSFGYRAGGIPADESGHGGGFVFDCRALPNPFRDERLRPHTGREPAVIAFLEAQPQVGDFEAHAAWLVLHAARTYAALGRERLMVSFGCTGGRHRSVYLAERLARRLEGEGFRVALRHLALESGDTGSEGDAGERDDPGGG
jgi:RNase adaptor protein for sRNA GlmZ degradation